MGHSTILGDLPQLCYSCPYKQLNRLLMYISGAFLGGMVLEYRSEECAAFLLEK